LAFSVAAFVLLTIDREKREATSKEQEQLDQATRRLHLVEPKWPNFSLHDVFLQLQNRVSFSTDLRCSSGPLGSMISQLTHSIQLKPDFMKNSSSYEQE
jgi:hypothetical protein